jgi:uncharacterized OsmC-like protein
LIFEILEPPIVYLDIEPQGPIPMAQALVHPLTATLNGFDLAAMDKAVQTVTEDPAQAIAAFRVESRWTGAAAAEHRVEAYELGGERIARRHTMKTDEPLEFFGHDTAPNPQEYLFAALNACMLFGYATKAAVLGIELEEVRIETRGSIDIRGAMGLAPVRPGFDSIACTVHLKARGGRQQLEELHQAVLGTSPNVYNLMSAIRLAPTLVVG